MDFDSIKNQVSNLTLYDLKAGVRKVQNAVMNYTEMEAKVREATNNDPWGAPSSLMQEIANGTHSYQLLNEIMPLLYKRFTDKTAEEWRQIYKSLQLLEFLVKNGSERVIDDARSHLSLLRMLRQFHYIDPNGKDQGVNVRNRAQELAKLLGDVEAIRAERKKARSNRNKYGGVEGGAGLGMGLPSSNRYGGFGSETGGFGDYRGEVYGDGGGFGGRETDFSDTQRKGEAFEEYDEEEEGGAAARKTTSRSTAARTAAAAAKRESLKTKPKQKEPEQDLFDFGDEPVTSSAAGKAPATNMNVLDDFSPAQSSGVAPDDDFDDFQSAASPAAIQPGPTVLSTFSPLPATTSTTTSATQFAAPRPVAPAQAANLQVLFATKSPSPSTTSTPGPSTATFSAPPSQPQAQPSPLRPSGTYAPSGPNYYTSVPTSINTTPLATSSSAFPSRPSASTTPSFGSSTAATLGKPTPRSAAGSSGADAFGSIWSSASNKAGIQNHSTMPNRGPDLASMAKAKSSAGIWAASGGAATPPAGLGVGGQRPGAIAPSPNTMANASTGGKPQTTLGNGLDDLLG